MKAALALIAAIVGAAPSLAQLASIGPFTGTQSESFEGAQVMNQTCMPQRVFSNTGDLCWSFFCFIGPHGGAYFFGSTGTAAEITFDQPVARFGGYFGTNSNTPNATFTFYDVNGGVIAVLLGAVPNDCGWHWLGWDAGSGAAIKRVLCSSQFGGGFLDMDDLTYDSGSGGQPPTAYCTSGTSSGGCVPSISANNNPSATLASPCTVSIANVESLKSGIVFYGINQAGFTPHPWGSGSNSFLCVKSPTQRTGVQNTGGTSGGCNGTLTFNWNAYQTAHPTSLGNPFSAGSKVYVQGWYRDPPATKTTSLSNALELTVVP
jgi:hypothetical protein